jgi:hypothetical protein
MTDIHVVTFGRMPPAAKKKLGRGAVAKCLVKFMHPAPIVKEAIGNRHGLKVLRLEVKTVNRKEQLCVVFTCDAVVQGTVELHAVRKYVDVLEEGDPDLFFEQVAEPTPPVPLEEEELPAVVLTALATGQILDADDIRGLNGAIEIDDDNAPAPENAVRNHGNTPECVYNRQWGHSGICERRGGSAVVDMPARLVHDSTSRLSYLELFELLFPKKFIIDTIIENLNKELSRQVQYGEFLLWLGLWFMMATIEGPSRAIFFSNDDICDHKGAPIRLNGYMSKIDSMKYSMH